MSKKIEFQEVLDFCKKAHEGQVRKHTGAPYYTHPYAVTMYLLDEMPHEYPLTGAMVIASLLHDTLEDCPQITKEMIEEKFGPIVLQYVVELTNVKHPESLTRKEKKELDRNRISTISDAAKVIKAADRICNLRDVYDMCPDHKWALRYAEESRELLRVLYKIPFDVFLDLEKAINAVERKYNVPEISLPNEEIPV